MAAPHHQRRRKDPHAFPRHRPASSSNETANKFTRPMLLSGQESGHDFCTNSSENLEVRMSQMAFNQGRSPAVSTATAEHGPAYQAYQILHVGFIVLPILAGIDKFFGVLTNWDNYLSPLGAKISGGHPHQFMLVVGVIEVVAGLGVAVMPRVFGYVVMAWLWAIIINLFLCHTFYDIALRDFGLSLGAVALARLAEVYQHRHAMTRTM